MLKSLLSIFILVLFIFSIGIFPATALAKGPKKEASTSLYVDPSSNRFSVGETFPIQVKLTDVTDLVVFDFKLGYDTSILDIVDVSVTPPSVWGSDYLTLKNGVNRATGVYWLAVAKLRTVPSFDGSTTLATITFRVTDTGTSSLDLYGTELVNSSFQYMPHDVSDGNFIYKGRGGGGSGMLKFIMGLSYTNILLILIAVIVVVVVVYGGFKYFAKKK